MENKIVYIELDTWNDMGEATDYLENFEKFCDKYSCGSCRFKECDSNTECILNWLDLKDNEGELKPCPFCGAGAHLISGTEDHYVVCRNDDCAAAIVARSFSSAEDAIAAWNRRVK